MLANLDRFQEVWVYDHDRLIRHAVFGPWVMGEIRQRGIRLWGPWGEDAPTPMGRFMTDVRMRFGAFYREESSDRTKENLDHRLREGLWMNHAPAGYTFAFENGEGSRRLLVRIRDGRDRAQSFRMMADASARSGLHRSWMNATTSSVALQPLYLPGYRTVRSQHPQGPLTLRPVALAMTRLRLALPGRHEPLVERNLDSYREPRHPLKPRSAPTPAWLLRADQVRVRKKMIIHRMKGNATPPSAARPVGACAPTTRQRTRSSAAIALLCCSTQYEQEVEAETRKSAPWRRRRSPGELARRRSRWRAS